MILEHIGLSQINGSLVVLEDVPGVTFDEMAELHLDDGSVRYGRVVLVEGDRCMLQIFEGTRNMSLTNTRTVLTGHPMMMELSPEILGRTLDGLYRMIGEEEQKIRQDPVGTGSAICGAAAVVATVPMLRSEQGAVAEKSAVAVATVREFLEQHPEIEEVRFVCFSEESAEAHRKALG